jgi:hypothetical protein
LVLSLIGVLTHSDRPWALAGLGVSGLMAALIACLIGMAFLS